MALGHAAIRWLLSVYASCLQCQQKERNQIKEKAFKGLMIFYSYSFFLKNTSFAYEQPILQPLLSAVPFYIRVHHFSPTQAFA